VGRIGFKESTLLLLLTSGLCGNFPKKFFKIDLRLLLLIKAPEEGRIVEGRVDRPERKVTQGMTLAG